MDCLNNIIQIIPGIFISDLNAKHCETKLLDFNIKYLINLNNTVDGSSLTTYNITNNEAITGLFTIGILAIYYLLLFVFKKQISNSFSFRIQ